MAVSRISIGVLTVALVLISALTLPAVHAQAVSAPAPAPTSDGSSIDQGIAYALMLVALALTYLIHAADLNCNL